jgi:hypothetical protein
MTPPDPLLNYLVATLRTWERSPVDLRIGRRCPSMRWFDEMLGGRYFKALRILAREESRRQNRKKKKRSIRDA